MENNKQYYIPDQEDIHFGYICQWLNEHQKWVDSVLDKGCTTIDSKWLRTKYLDKQDIESLGWKYTGRSIDIWFEEEGEFERTSWTSYKAILHYNLEDKWLFIHLRDQGTEHEIFEGKCMSVNELKKLMKMLNIPINGK